MANLNKVFLIGRLTKDPELRYLPNGTPKAELRLATSREYKGRDGQMQKDTCYVDVVVWSRQAETCSQYLAKGRQIHVEGRLDYQEWEDKNTGGKRSKHQIVADHVQFLDGRGQGGGGQGADENMGADDESMAGASGAPSFQGGGGGNSGGGNFGGRSYGNNRGGNGGGGWSRGNAGGAQTYGARSDAPPAGAPQAAVSAPPVEAAPRDDRPMAEAMGVKDEDLPF